jgi:hypothetical protein
VLAEPFQRCRPQQHITTIIINYRMLSIRAKPLHFAASTSVAVAAQPSQVCAAVTATLTQGGILQRRLQLALPHRATKHSQGCAAVTAALKQGGMLQWRLQLALPHRATKHCAAPAAALPV